MSKIYGKYIEGLGLATSILSIPAALFIGIGTMYDNFILGLILLLVIGFVGFTAGVLTSGYGQLIQNTLETKELLEEQNKTLKSINDNLDTKSKK